MLADLQTRVNYVAKEVGGEYTAKPPEYRERKIIRDTIWGFHDLNSCFLVILDSPYLQRLRHIHQTALTYHTYPSAEHSRFEHSVGAWHISGMMLEAIERRQDKPIPKEISFQVKMAALLHDTGHGPFSHASEDVYRQSDIFDEIRKEDEATFLNASASEILSFCLLSSPSFQDVWRVSVERATKEKLLDSANSVSIKNVGRMILGTTKDLAPELKPFKDIVNGPFDADKLDYLTRDGHFTGLQVPVDADRLLWGIRITKSAGEDVLAVDASSTSALEQIIFGKAQLYTQIYHHHKVRAAARLIYRLIETLDKIESPYGELDLKDPSSFLALDDGDLIAASYKQETTKDIVRRMKLRLLPKRCLVITNDCINEDDDESRSNWSAFKKDIGESGRWLAEIKQPEKELAALANVDPSNVMIDIPVAPKFTGPGHALIYYSPGNIRPLNEVFPAEGWANAHEAYRSAAYVFALPEKCELRTVRDAAEKWLKDKVGTTVNGLSREMAKLAN